MNQDKAQSGNRTERDCTDHCHTCGKPDATFWFNATSYCNWECCDIDCNGAEMTRVYYWPECGTEMTLS